MSEAHIEDDAERAARKEATALVGYDGHGKESFALFLIDPSGNLVQAAIGTKLKSGWRYASRADYEAKLDLELARKAKEATAQADVEAPAAEVPADKTGE